MSGKTSLVRNEVNQAMDALEMALLDRFPQIECPLKHDFGDHLYMRQIIMPRGAKITSKTHKHRHPYFVLYGKAKVWKDDGQGWQIIEAPHYGWTDPGTRRVLDILEDTVWITVHYNPTNTEDLSELEEFIIEPHTNNLLKEGGIQCPGSALE